MKPIGKHNLSRHPNIRAIPTGPTTAAPVNETPEVRLRRLLRQMPPSVDRTGGKGLMLKFLRTAVRNQESTQ